MFSFNTYTICANGIEHEEIKNVRGRAATTVLKRTMKRVEKTHTTITVSERRKKNHAAGKVPEVPEST